MNSLGIDLKEGQQVVMEGDCPEDLRTVTVKDGFGTQSKLRGSALFVTLANGMRGRMNAMEIERVVE